MRRTWIMYGLLAGVILLVFGRVCGFEFIEWDDGPLIFKNDNLVPSTWSGIWFLWTHAHYHMYIPVTYSAWAALAWVAYVGTPDQMGALINPQIFHAANLLVHVLNAVLVLTILRMLIGRDWPSVLGAMIFALHPLQVEPVAWASGMKDLLSTFFALLALWQYLLHASSNHPRRFFTSHYLLATTAFTLAMLAKPGIVILPLMALTIDYLLLNRPIKVIARDLGVWLALSVVFIFITLRVQPGEQLIGSPMADRPWIAGFSLAFYLYKLIFPCRLAVDYGWRPQIVMQQPWIYFVWLVPAGLFIAMWLGRRRWRWFTAAGLLFVIPLIPVLGLTNFIFQYFSTVADRYAYLSLLGVALGAAGILAHFRTRIFPVLGILIVVLLGMLSSWQVAYWKDGNLLFNHVLHVNPDSAVAHTNIASRLCNQGRLQEGLEHYEIAARLRPDFQQTKEGLRLARDAMRLQPTTTLPSNPPPK